MKKSGIAYTVFWNNNEVGRIYKSEDEKYKYLPNCIEISAVSAPIEVLGNAQTSWGDLPIFFKERLNLDPDCKNNCSSDNDMLTIRKDNY